MPLYEYECPKCHHRFELIEKNTAPETHKCPKCGAKAQRLLAAPAIQFKGSGWYVTDYAGKSGGASGSSSDGGDKSSEKSGNSDKSKSEKKESKPEKSAAPSSGKTDKKS